MLVIPNSYGARLRERNDCHEPGGSSKGGEFCSKDKAPSKTAQLVRPGQAFDIAAAARQGVAPKDRFTRHRQVSRRFLFNPTSGELVVGSAMGYGDEGSHAEALDIADGVKAGVNADSSRTRRHDRFSVHGFLESPVEGPLAGRVRIVLDNVMPDYRLSREEKQAAAHDAAYAFFSRISRMGADADTLVEVGRSNLWGLGDVPGTSEPWKTLGRAYPDLFPTKDRTKTRAGGSRRTRPAARANRTRED